MPSINKTQNIGLNQWQGNEYIKREDFVNDNYKIDEEIGKLRNKANIVVTEDPLIERQVGSFYFIVTDTQSNLTGGIQVSPNMGIKIEE